MRLSFLMVMERMLLRQVFWIHTGQMVGQGGCRAIWVLLWCARVWLGTLQHLLHSEFSEQWILLHLICYGFVSHGEVISYQSAKIDPNLDLQLWYVKSISDVFSLTYNDAVLFPPNSKFVSDLVKNRQQVWYCWQEAELADTDSTTCQPQRLGKLD